MTYIHRVFHFSLAATCCPSAVKDCGGNTGGVPLEVTREIFVGHGGSFTAVVRRVLFRIRFRVYQCSFDLYHHGLGTPVGGQFLMYIRALRATLNKTDRSFNPVSLPIS
jgi:hypothetical protein